MRFSQLDAKQALLTKSLQENMLSSGPQDYRLSRVTTYFFSILCVLALTGTVFLAAASAALANHGDTANSGRLNTSVWRLCVAGAPTNVATLGAYWAISQVNSTTNVSAAAVCTGASNVHITAASYPDSWYGLTTCNSKVQNGLCKTSKNVKLNARVITTAQQGRKTALHELGHVAGLGHRTVNTSVMKSGASPPISQNFDSHD